MIILINGGRTRAPRTRFMTVKSRKKKTSHWRVFASCEISSGCRKKRVAVGYD